MKIQLFYYNAWCNLPETKKKTKQLIFRVVRAFK